MTTLKSILLSSALITTMFGADMVRPTDLNGDAPVRKAHQTEAAPLAVTNTAGQARPRGKNGRFVKVKKARAAGGEVETPARKAHRAEAATVACPPLPGEVWARICAMVPAAESDVVLALSRTPELCTYSEATETVIKDRETLQKNWGNIVASLLCSNTPVHEMMEANGFDDPRYLMSMIGIKEDTFEGREVGRYEHTDRKEIAAKFMRYAEKTIITAAAIAAGRQVNHGDVVVLSYNDMVTHKAALNGKDIHLCVDVHADANGQLVFNESYLPQGLKKLYFQNTRQDVTSIGDGFLFECTGLTQVDLTPLSKVTSIGKGFLSNCSGLTQVDLSPLSSVTSVGDGFLAGCIRLTQVDLSPLSKVTTIGHEFLRGCTGLTQVNLSGLTKVTSIGEGFLYECKELTRVDLSPLRNLLLLGT